MSRTVKLGHPMKQLEAIIQVSGRWSLLHIISIVFVAV